MMDAKNPQINLRIESSMTESDFSELPDVKSRKGLRSTSKKQM